MCYAPPLFQMYIIGIFCMFFIDLQAQLSFPVYTILPDAIDRVVPSQKVQAAWVPDDADWKTICQTTYVSYTALQDTNNRWYKPLNLCIRFGLENPADDSIRLWYQTCNNDYRTLCQTRLTEGNADVTEKPVYIRRPGYSFTDIVLPPKAIMTCYILYPDYQHDIGRQGIHFYSFETYIKQSDLYHKDIEQMVFSSVIILSVLLFAGIFFSFYYIYMQNAMYGWYIAYIFSTFFFFLYHLERLASLHILLSYIPRLLSFSEGLFIAASSFTYLGFMSSFFDLHRLSPRRARWIRFFMFLPLCSFGIILLLELLFYREDYAALLFDTVGLLVSVLQVLSVLLILSGKKTFPEKIVLTGIMALLIGAGISILVPYPVRLAWLGANHMVFIKAGVFLEIIFFSLALVIKSRDSLIESAQIREQIARDLHDEVGSTLSSISVLSGTLSNTETQINMQKHLQLIGERTREVITSMDDIVWSVNPRNDNLTDALDRLKDYGREVLENQQTRLHFDVSSTAQRLTLSMEQRKAILLIAKEALHNAAKHALAHDVWITFDYQGRILHLTVRDNGMGFSLEKIKRGNGLSNMQARAAKLGGEIHIESETIEGTRIKLECPIT